jgi:uncharacterized damage-inducible protein DinB
MPEFPQAPDRADPPFVADERTMLESWLDFHRATLLWKCAGLSAAQLRQRSVEPSSMSLLGLVRHMTEVERNWFRRVIAAAAAEPLYYSRDNPDGDFDDVDTADADADLSAYRAEVDACRQLAAAYDLDATGLRRGRPVSLRWVYLHMIEEYARHNGHADLLRERIDGLTGD